MTEAEWLEAAEPGPMLARLGDGPGLARKLRLFAVACCRRSWDLLPEGGPSRRALEAHEAYADGLIGEAALRKAVAGAEAASMAVPNSGSGSDRDCAIVAAGSLGLDLKPSVVASWAADVAGCRAIAARFDPATYYGLSDDDQYDACVDWFHPARRAEAAAQAGLLREILGGPAPPPAIDPAWLGREGRAVPRLARAIYDGRDFGGMPRLADALRRVGCADARILEHCGRVDGHVRGCWVVDALIG